MPSTLAQAIGWARAELVRAGVGSPDADAVLLAAHALGLSRGETEAKAILGAAEPEGYRELVRRRARREPLQHITGTAPFRQLELAVGPGVFVPRPETELLVQLTLDRAHAWRESGETHPAVIDLGTGSGAIALAVATEDPACRVSAVEREAAALPWSRRNLRGSAVRLLECDYRDVAPETAGRFCVVVTNPPYVPSGEVPEDPEVRDHDPATALYGGDETGMLLPCAAMDTALRVLRPEGSFIMEHAESQVELVARALADRGFRGIQVHHDLTGRPRATTAELPEDLS
ncbi:peptide chain release factor N(5)-glutamine methyltransferase [Kocuria tytonis]|uniref:peptide chain release factor N(5)-glutamine methyltransferase n=1 Tax=Kocuria tytonis TaxID=2054280 RepID=A0A495A9E2_9MICC|nr:peptide chain release factor N(5)-glutamine methyltransferase [Kocuria tytonis]RKQ36666.1 peptide chain release factor N(5)-glutamine methyltransferase [Kocuria tytonis]